MLLTFLGMKTIKNIIKLLDIIGKIDDAYQYEKRLILEHLVVSLDDSEHIDNIEYILANIIDRSVKKTRFALTREESYAMEQNNRDRRQYHQLQQQQQQLEQQLEQAQQTKQQLLKQHQQLEESQQQNTLTPEQKQQLEQLPKQIKEQAQQEHQIQHQLLQIQLSPLMVNPPQPIQIDLSARAAAEDERLQYTPILLKSSDIIKPLVVEFFDWLFTNRMKDIRSGKCVLHRYYYMILAATGRLESGSKESDELIKLGQTLGYGPLHSSSPIFTQSHRVFRFSNDFIENSNFDGLFEFIGSTNDTKSLDYIFNNHLIPNIDKPSELVKGGKTHDMYFSLLSVSIATCSLKIFQHIYENYRKFLVAKSPITDGIFTAKQLEHLLIDAMELDQLPLVDYFIETLGYTISSQAFNKLNSKAFYAGNYMQVNNSMKPPIVNFNYKNQFK